MFTESQLEEMVDLLVRLDDNTKVYLGCDSIRYVHNGKRMARFATVAIVHMNGKNGCRVFSHISHEPDYDVKASRPSVRLMNEVMKVCQLYSQIAPLIDEYEIEIHLDVSTDPKNGSNCVASQAAGYVLGMTGQTPVLKPLAWASSFGGDHVARGKLAEAA